MSLTSACQHNRSHLPLKVYPRPLSSSHLQPMLARHSNHMLVLLVHRASQNAMLVEQQQPNAPTLQTGLPGKQRWLF